MPMSIHPYGWRRTGRRKDGGITGASDDSSWVQTGSDYSGGMRPGTNPAGPAGPLTPGDRRHDIGLWEFIT